MQVSRFARRALVFAATALLSASCGAGDQRQPEKSPDRAAAGAALAPAAAPASVRPQLVILGDSLTAGLGLEPEQAYPAILQQRLELAGFDYEVVNAGVSGDTSAGGLSRLDWSLAKDVQILVVALGGNDALRGLPVDELHRNLEEIIKRAQARQITVILAGIEAPPNFGRVYTEAFRQVYRGLAKDYSLPLVPFLLEGVAGIEAMNQPDGIHPTAAGARIAADNVWKILEPVLSARNPGRRR